MTEFLLWIGSAFAYALLMEHLVLRPHRKDCAIRCDGLRKYLNELTCTIQKRNVELTAWKRDLCKVETAVNAQAMKIDTLFRRIDELEQEARRKTL